jgi:hypothetical protein
MDAPNTSIFATHFGSTLAVIGGIQWLKNSRWFPFLQSGAKIANRWASIIAALAVSVGIHYTWNPQDHSLLLTGLSLSTIGIGLFHVATQFFYQETGYQVLQGVQSAQKILTFLQTNSQQPGAMKNAGIAGAPPTTK